MRQPLRLCLAAVGLILCAAPVFAEEDDLLRPMIVRPTDGAPSAPPSKDYIPEPTPRGMQDMDTSPLESSIVSRTRETAPAPMASGGPKLKVPRFGASSSSSSSSMAVPAPPVPVRDTVRDETGVFANFGPSTGSAISDKVFKLRDQTVTFLRKLEQNTSSFNDVRGKGVGGAIQYHSTVAAITARLETGTTRGNPILKRQWKEAELALNEVSGSLSRLTALSTDLSATSATATKITREVKDARELTGAVDEDHLQLDMIRDELAKGTVQLDGMRENVAKDIQRQTAYLSTEKQNLKRLADSIDKGEIIRASATSAPAPTVTPMAPEEGAPEIASIDSSGDMMGSSALPGNPGTTGSTPILPQPGFTVQPPPASAAGPGQLLVLVRFNQEVVNYEQPLYQAVSDALDRKPDAAFTVVAVAPKSDDRAALQGDTQSAQRHANDVKNSLKQLGLQASRITSNSISSEAAQVPEVHVYVR